MKLLGTCALVAVALLVSAGCGKKVISSLQRKQAANLATEASFAATMRDFARAESLLVQATEICPDAGPYWLTLGSARMKLGNRSGARAAYKRALGAFEDAAESDRTAAEPALQVKLRKQYPNSRDIRAFVDGKQLDQILADPIFKELAL